MLDVCRAPALDCSHLSLVRWWTSDHNWSNVVFVDMKEFCRTVLRLHRWFQISSTDKIAKKERGRKSTSESSTWGRWRGWGWSSKSPSQVAGRAKANSLFSPPMVSSRPCNLKFLLDHQCTLVYSKTTCAEEQDPLCCPWKGDTKEFYSSEPERYRDCLWQRHTHTVPAPGSISFNPITSQRTQHTFFQ